MRSVPPSPEIPLILAIQRYEEASTDKAADALRPLLAKESGTVIVYRERAYSLDAVGRIAAAQARVIGWGAEFLEGRPAPPKALEPEPDEPPILEDPE